MLTLFTVVFLLVAVSLASALEMQQVKAIGVAEAALGRAIAVGSDQIIPKEKLRDAVPGGLYPVHHPRTLEPSYGIVPILSPDGEVVGLIGIDASSSSAIWYSFNPPTGVFPPVSSRTARQRVQMKAGPAGQTVQTAEPILVSGCDKHLYWRFQGGSGEAVYVNCTLPDAEILSSRNGSSERVTTAETFETEQRMAPREEPRPVSTAPAQVLTNGVYPAAYDIPGVPYHYQIESLYCGCASIQMVLDYHGEEIPQHDIADVVYDPVGGYSVFNDAGKAFAFSPMSTSKNDPTLQGYAERELGYAGLVFDWYLNTKEERRAGLKGLVLTNHPVNIGGWYDASMDGGHWRVLKGYDDSLNVFVFHDPWYSYSYCGPNLLIDQDLWLDVLWNHSPSWDYSARVAVPLVLRADLPAAVSEGDTFTVDLKVVYPGLYPPYGIHPIHDGTASLWLHPASNLSLAGGSQTVAIPDMASGDSATVSWDVIAESGAGSTETLKFSVNTLHDYWAWSYGTSTDSIGGHILEVVDITSALTAEWDSEERLTDDDMSSETCAPHARSMAVEDNGTTHIVWQDMKAGGAYIYYMKQVGGTWQAPVQVSSDTVFCHTPCIAVDPSGGVHIAWADGRVDREEIYYRSWTIGSGWSLEEQVTNATDIACFPCIVADDSLVHIAYEERLGGLYRAHAVFHTYRNAIGWSTPVDVDAAAARDSFRPSLAFGADGTLHVVYERHTANTPNEHEKIVHKSWDGIVWSGRTGLSSDLSYSRTPCIAAGDDGTLHVVWQDGENLGGDIYYTWYDGTTWELVPYLISGGISETCTPSVGVDAGGEVFVAWVDYRHGESEIYMRQGRVVELIPGSGVYVWQGPTSRFTDATGHSMLPCVCAMGDESASVLWTDLRHGSPEIYYKGPDAGSGIITDPDVPAGSLLELSLPRPQPFLSDVRLSLTVGEATDITIEVYDITGRIVCELGHGCYEPGTFNVTWSGKSSSGDRVSPGVYFISCKSKLGNEVRRVVMVR
jgi:hypothetical protein